MSIANKQQSVVLQHSTLSAATVEFSYTVYDYAPIEKLFHKEFHTGSTYLKRLIAKPGDGLSLDIDMNRSIEVLSPKNFEFYLGVLPQEKA